MTLRRLRALFPKVRFVASRVEAVVKNLVHPCFIFECTGAKCQIGMFGLLHVGTMRGYFILSACASHSRLFLQTERRQNLKKQYKSRHYPSRYLSNIHKNRISSKAISRTEHIRRKLIKEYEESATVVRRVACHDCYKFTFHLPNLRLCCFIKLSFQAYFFWEITEMRESPFR